MNRFFFLACLSMLSLSVQAVEPLLKEKPRDPNEPLSFVEQVLKDLGASDHYDNTKPIDFSVLPGPFYTPEMKLGIGLSAVGLYQFGESKGTDAQPSNITVNAFLSSNFSAGITVHNTTLLHHGQQRFEFSGELSKSPDVFYGIGYHAGQDNSNKVDFTHSILQISPTYYFNLRDNLYIGLGFDYKNTRAENLEQDIPDSFDRSTLNSNQELGFLLNFTYDSRDYLLNASKGWLFQLDMGTYFDALGDDEFYTYNVNLANYVDLSPLPGLIAWQVKGAFTDGSVPWSYMPVVGGDDNLRGYLEGRYHDEQIVYSQVEYRLPIIGRHGMVAWVGSASMGEDINDIGEHFLMSYGVGYRFRIKDRINLRLDYAKGEHDSTVYFNVNEAF